MWVAIPAFVAAATGVKLATDMHIMMHPPQFVDLTPGNEGTIGREKRPASDAILHVLLFRWQILGNRYVFDD